MNEALARLGEIEDTETSPPSRGQARGRLMVALDLTGSREHSLQQARSATASMFDAIKTLGAIAVKLVYYRGEAECRASQWHTDPDILSRAMQRLSCETGYTQIARVLRLALAEAGSVSGMVFVGDHCEDNPDELRELAAKLGRRSFPLFVFHECADDDERSLKAKPIFKLMAEVSAGAYVEFKPDSGAVLRELLASVGEHAVAGVDGVRGAGHVETPQAKQLRSRLLALPAPAPGEA